jgi:hypothetical protein
MSRIRSSSATSAAAFTVAGVGGEGLGADHVHRDRHRGAARLHRVDHGLGLGHQVGLGQALADLQARRPA